MYKRFKQTIFRVIQPAQGYDLPSKVFDCAIMALIAVSVVSTVSRNSSGGVKNRFMS